MPYCRAHPVLQNSKIKSLYELSAQSYLILNLKNIWILKSTEKRIGANEKFEHKEKEKYLKIIKFNFFIGRNIRRSLYESVKTLTHPIIFFIKLNIYILINLFTSNAKFCSFRFADM